MEISETCIAQGIPLGVIVGLALAALARLIQAINRGGCHLHCLGFTATMLSHQAQCQVACECSQHPSSAETVKILQVALTEQA